MRTEQTNAKLYKRVDTKDGEKDQYNVGNQRD